MKRVNQHVLLLGAVLALLVAFQQDTSPSNAPDEHRFREVFLTGNMPDLIEMDIAANGDIYFITMNGSVWVYDLRQKDTRLLGTVPTSHATEAHMQAIVLDPGFSQNHRLFLLYAPVNKGKFNRVSRFTIQDDSLMLSSEKVVLEIPDSQHCCHAGGGMTFDKHGNLFITTGDNTNPFGTNYSPSDERPGREEYDAQRSSANTNDLRGKVLRIHPEDDGTYTIPPGNLFAKTEKTRPEIYIMGCRNPYRVTVDRDTDLLYWSEVGPDASDTDRHGPRGYDEINQAAKPGNHGWPLVIGNNEPYAKVDFASEAVVSKIDPVHPINSSPNNTGLRDLPPAQKPLIWYPYDNSAEFPQLGAGGRTAIMGPIYYYDPQNPSPAKFPAYFDRKLFIADWMRNWLKVVSLTEQKQLKSIDAFMPSTTFRKPISMKFGPDGSLYVIEHGALWGNNKDSRLVRIDYIPGNRPPIAKLDAIADAGAAPMPLQLSASHSIDYDQADQLTYRWLVDGRTLSPTSANIRHVITKPGRHFIKVIVSDKAGASSSAETSILVGNSPPNVAVELPDTGLLRTSTVTYRVRVTDAEDKQIDPQRIAVKLAFIPSSRALMQSSSGAIVSEYQRGLTWIEENDCKACHAQAIKSVGPSFQMIAERYQPQKKAPELVAALSRKISKGGYGVWGEANMSAHPQLAPDVTDEMVRYILSLTDEMPVERDLPVEGQFAVDLNQPGTYVLTASYTDRGHKKIGPITRQTSKVLRSPVFTGQDFDKGLELRRSNILTGINRASYAMAQQVDMTGVRALDFQFVSETPGTVIRLRSDSPTGDVLGEVPVPTGKWKAWQERSVPIKALTGRHDIYLCFENRNSIFSLAEVKAVTFRRSD
ncbi:PQQ-dependent sugar dehydrogenase [Spirosoma sp. KNUC1025]|uniref:PQQ-dependent sugar dehydrogenase n=1 Tax=Spirosoma sp. KNUC1025 TaxID=2894082 RepID=UPI00386FCAAE|nr:PQQ-dependent sugar dehydrogenase [Spirosoma sp. KNUC1025]